MTKITVKQAVDAYPLLMGFSSSRNMGAAGFKIATMIRKSITPEVEEYEKRRNEFIKEHGEPIMKDGKPTEGLNITDPEKIKELVAMLEEIGKVEIELPTTPCATLETVAAAKVTVYQNGLKVIDDNCLNGAELEMVSFLFEEAEKPKE